MKVAHYKEMTELVYDDLSPVGHNIEMISIYDDIDPADVRKMSVAQVRDKVRDVKKALATMGSSEEVLIGGETLYRKPFDELTLGEFIDMDSYLIGAELDNMLAVLYRVRTGGGMRKYEYELYSSVNLEYRSKLFLQLESEDVMGVITEYKEYRNNIVATYKSLFENEDDDILTEDDVMTNDERKMMEAQELHGQFAWEALILFLCNDDITKWDQVTDMSLLLTLNIASYRKSVLRNAQ